MSNDGVLSPILDNTNKEPPKTNSGLLGSIFSIFKWGGDSNQKSSSVSITSSETKIPNACESNPKTNSEKNEKDILDNLDPLDELDPLDQIDLDQIDRLEEDKDAEESEKYIEDKPTFKIGSYIVWQEIIGTGSFSVVHKGYHSETRSVLLNLSLY